MLLNPRDGFSVERAGRLAPDAKGTKQGPPDGCRVERELEKKGGGKGRGRRGTLPPLPDLFFSLRRKGKEHAEASGDNGVGMVRVSRRASMTFIMGYTQRSASQVDLLAKTEGYLFASRVRGRWGARFAPVSCHYARRCFM